MMIRGYFDLLIRFYYFVMFYLKPVINHLYANFNFCFIDVNISSFSSVFLLLCAYIHSDKVSKAEGGKEREGSFIFLGYV